MQITFEITDKDAQSLKGAFIMWLQESKAGYLRGDWEVRENYDSLIDRAQSGDFDPTEFAMFLFSTGIRSNGIKSIGAISAFHFDLWNDQTQEWEAVG